MGILLPPFLNGHPEAIVAFREASLMLDLTMRADSFNAAVNAAQQSRITNRQAASTLGYFSRLPLAAKNFVRGALEGVPDLGGALHILDTICAEHALVTAAVMRRWQSGIFVRLPVSQAVIAVERHCIPIPFSEALAETIRERRSSRLRGEG